MKSRIIKRLLYWLVYSLNAVDFVDFTCALIRHLQTDKNCQEVIYRSCGHCPGGVKKGEGIRALGFPEGGEGVKTLIETGEMPGEAK